METNTIATEHSADVKYGNIRDYGYDSFMQRVQDRFLNNCDNGRSPLFTTDAEGLWNMYLETFMDPGERQYHNCNACRHFIERFGSLAIIGEDGRIFSAIWDETDAPDAYRDALKAMSKAVRRAKVTGMFFSSAPMWGTPVTGEWHHFAVRPSSMMRFNRATQTENQAMAEKREDFKAVMHALNEFTFPHLETALKLLKSNALYRSEKVIGQAEWLHGLHVARATAHGFGKANVVWQAIATAPAGFCHPRSSMIGTLLEDIAAGKDFGSVSRAFAAKMHPLAYQRPQAAPTAGSIAVAEKVIQQLGAAGALARRFARVDELQALWRMSPKEGEPSHGGVFGHLKPKGAKGLAMNIPAQTMTWDKFQRTVLSTAERIEFMAPRVGSYTALVTAVNADAPPILQWDREDARNPVSWYFWHGGSSAESFGLLAGLFYEVEAVTLQPSMWNGGNEHHGAGVMFVIANARESKQAGAALFPEIMKAELHGIRSVLESYSRGASIDGMGDPHAAGVMLTAKNNVWNATVRVWSNGKSLDYRLDRWD